MCKETIKYQIVGIVETRSTDPGNQMVGAEWEGYSEKFVKIQRI